MTHFQFTAMNNSNQVQTWSVEASDTFQVPANGGVQGPVVDIATPESYGINVEQGGNFAGVRLDLTDGGAVLYPQGNPFGLAVAGNGMAASPYLVTITCANLADENGISRFRPRLFG